MFILVTLMDDDRRILINTDSIKSIIEYTNGCRIVLKEKDSNGNAMFYDIKESNLFSIREWKFTKF